MKYKRICTSFLLSTLCVAGLVCAAVAQQPTQSIYKGTVGKTLAQSTEWWPQTKKAPAGAPNIIWILLDDVGFGASSSFGGLIQTPILDSIAGAGLRYTNFHTTALCSPTRAALLTGRNHHAVHMGFFPEKGLSSGFPGYDAKIPSEKGFIAEILKENGYNTFAVGKWHLTPDGELSDAGPFDRWPLGKGFQHYFGYLTGATDQYKTDLVEDNAHVKPDGRHLNEQLIDKSIFYISKQQKADSAKPFFLYLAPGATHAPHQVDTFWSNKYKGRFDEGWDVYRQRVIENQKKLGVIPANAQLPARNPRIKAWNDLSPEQQKLSARFFEVYAGYLEYTDHEIGRLINYLKQAGLLNNTAIFIMIGDNGASKEGTQYGIIDKTSWLSRDEDLLYNIKHYDKIGTPDVVEEANYPLGWAQAANTPFKEWKQDANAEGGTHNPLIVFYPKGIIEKGGIRNQYSHVIDLLPTTVDIAGLTLPATIKGIKQDAIQGTSFYYSLNNAKAPSKHTVQYYELPGAIAIYKDGWKAERVHFPTTLELGAILSGNSNVKPYDTWSLYNLNEDFNEINDLSKTNPEKLKTLQDLFDKEATKNNVYPIQNWEDIVKRLFSANKK
ncbi:MAG: arylsulfatase [Agriterribacter sp.]